MEGVIISSRRCYCWVYLHQFSYFFFQGAFTHLEPFLAVLFLFLPWNILAEKGQWCVFLSVITLSNDWIDWRLTNLIIIISSTSPPLHIVTTLHPNKLQGYWYQHNIVALQALPCTWCPWPTWWVSSVSPWRAHPSWSSPGGEKLNSLKSH